MWNAKEHASLIAPIRERLQASGLPYIIENVEGARRELIDPVMLCGTMFGLGVDDAELRRHRLFEINFDVGLLPQCNHSKGRVIGIYGGHGRDRRRKQNTQDFSVQQRRDAMGIDWCGGQALSNAIPPAYTEYLGKQLMAHLQRLTKTEAV